MDRALYDFAEAAMGKNSNMRWSLSEEILRRQMSPVFERCSKGDLEAEAALDIVIDFTSARFANTLEVFIDLFNVLQTKISIRWDGTKFPALVELQELFLGLNVDMEWATDENITRRELYPLFVRLAIGTVSSDDALVTVCETMSSKRDYYLDTVQALAYRLAEDISHVNNHDSA